MGSNVRKDRNLGYVPDDGGQIGRAQRPRNQGNTLPIENGIYYALASDGDGTLIRSKHLAKSTRTALERWRALGRKILLVTGETPKDLKRFPYIELFDLVIAENGAMILDPASGNERLLAEPPPVALVRVLHRAKIKPLDSGRVIISTEYSQEAKVLEILDRFNNGWQCVHNRRHVMILPRRVSKASGLAAALKLLGFTRREVIGVGDAENDIPLLEACGVGVADRLHDGLRWHQVFGGRGSCGMRSHVDLGEQSRVGTLPVSGSRL